jgi:hypothetical protein
MTEDDLLRVAERRTEMVNPGCWPTMSDQQKSAVLRDGCYWARAFLFEGFMMRSTPVKVTVE